MRPSGQTPGMAAIIAGECLNGAGPHVAGGYFGDLKGQFMAYRMILMPHWMVLR